MRATNFVLVAALLATASPFVVASKVPNVDIPDWVQRAADQPKGTYPDDTNAVVLLTETSIHVNSPEEYIEHNRTVIRILRPEGSRRAVFTEYYKTGEKVLNAHAWSIDSEGHKFEVKPKEFITTSPYFNEGYTDVQLVQTRVPGGEAGSVVAFEAETLRHPYKSDANWLPQESIPVKSATFSIELPAGLEYNSFWANSDDIKPQQVAPNTWKWTISDLPGIKDEPFRLSGGALEKRLEVAFYGSGVSARSGSWNTIGSWYTSLIAPRRASSPEVSEAAHRITANAHGFDAQVRAIADFLQRDIRYVAISIGIGGYQPHFANETFRHKYGDCKDKATLMSVMLKELGYRSELVLLSTHRGLVTPTVPSSYFNHAIIAIELPKDVPDSAYPAMVKTKSGVRYVIFDPTNEYTPFGLIPSYEQTSYVLVASDPGELVQLPLLAPTLNLNERAGKFTLSTDGALIGEVIQKLTGDGASDMRNRLGHFDGKDRSQFLEASANASLKQASIESFDFENLKEIDKDLVIKYKVAMPSYSQKAGTLVLVRPRVFGDKALHLPKKERTYAIDLEGSRRDHDVYEIKLPAGFVVDELPDNTHIDVGFAMYDSKIETVGDSIRYTREYVIRDPHIELSKLDDVRRLENAIAGDQFATAVLKKAP